ncbi:MAG: tetratricopeptide repeat protein [Spongiibacteraceae bacterium]|nr:tetratricopeptide repeat protein [Spongiibacteraceae bacterium]
MKFINGVGCTGLLLLVISSSACQFMPTTSEIFRGEPEAQSTKQAAAVELENATLPNPYLLERPSTSKEVRRRFQTAKQAMFDENWAQAQSDLEWLTQYYPTLSGPYLNLALLHRQLERPEKAESAFKKAARVNPNNVNAYNHYAIFLREQGRFTDARVQYLKALDVWPDHPDSHRNLGILYDLYMGKFEQALPHYKRYQELLDKPDRTIKGWIVDTQRRVKRAGKTQ